MTNLILIAIALVLVFLNAFFVAAEFAMVKLRHTRLAALKKRYGLRGKILNYVHRHLDAYLSACQLGITLASLGLGWVGEPAFAHLLEPLFQWLHLASPHMVQVASFFVAFSVISFLHIVVGELMPKSLAIRQAETISVWTAVPLYGFYWLMFPAIWLLNSCALFLLNVMGLGQSNSGEQTYGSEEIKLILNTSHLHGELTSDEAKILEQTLDFADLKVTEVMRSQDEMITVTLQQPIDTILATVAEHRYSRYPVYDQKKEEIIGIIHVKDLFSAVYQQHTIESLTPFIRPVLKVSPRLPALNLLRQFREGMPHFALVYKSGSLLGFVTLDNLLHILIGRIKDEFHRTQDDWTVNTDGSLTMKGDCPIFSLERALDRDIDMSHYEREPQTLAGLIIQQLGYLPQEGQRIDFPDFQATIKKMRGSRLMKIKITPKTPTRKIN